MSGILDPIDLSQVSNLTQLRQAIQQCRRCDIRQYARQVVLSRGTGRIRIMFVGEAPGRDEDKNGRPFSGKAGGMFDDMCKAFDFTTDDAYVSNVCRCIPFPNTAKIKVPEPEHIVNCQYILDKEIELVKPLLLVALGMNAMRGLLSDIKASAKITPLVGKMFYSDRYKLPVVCMFHPSSINYVSNPKRATQDWIEVLARALVLYEGLEALDEYISGHDQKGQGNNAAIPAITTDPGAPTFLGGGPTSIDFPPSSTPSNDLEGIDDDPAFWDVGTEDPKEVEEEPGGGASEEYGPETAGDA